MDVFVELAKQGTGYLMAVIAMLALVYVTKKLFETQEKRVADNQQYKDSYIANSRDLLNAQTNLQKSVDNMVEILSNLRIKK